MKPRTKYVSVRLTEKEAGVLWSAADCGSQEVFDTIDGSPDLTSHQKWVETAALERALSKLASAKPRTRKQPQK